LERDSNLAYYQIAKHPAAYCKLVGKKMPEGIRKFLIQLKTTQKPSLILIPQ